SAAYDPADVAVCYLSARPQFDVVPREVFLLQYAVNILTQILFKCSCHSQLLRMANIILKAVHQNTGQKRPYSKPEWPETTIVILPAGGYLRVLVPWPAILGVPCVLCS